MLQFYLCRRGNVSPSGGAGHLSNWYDATESSLSHRRAPVTPIYFLVENCLGFFGQHEIHMILKMYFKGSLYFNQLDIRI